MARYYEPSGKYDPKSFLYFILISLIAIPLLSLIYAYAIWYIPFVYINFFIAAGFGFGITFLVELAVVNYGKVRSKKLSIIFAILAFLIAYYCHWVVWISLLTEAPMLSVLSNPAALLEIIQEVNQYGTWGIKSSDPVSGVMLTIIWVIEALIIGVVAFITAGAGAEVPFCELNNEWFEEKTLPPFNFIENRPEMISNLEQSSPETFKVLTQCENLESHHSIFTLFTSNHDENYLSITNNRATINKKKEIEFEATEFIKHIYINSELKQLLLAK